jgi:hypothetical protein
MALQYRSVLINSIQHDRKIDISTVEKYLVKSNFYSFLYFLSKYLYFCVTSCPGPELDSDIHDQIRLEIRVQGIWRMARRVPDHPGTADLIVIGLMHMAVNPEGLRASRKGILPRTFVTVSI